MKQNIDRKFITKMIKLAPGYSYPVRIELDPEEDKFSSKKDGPISSDLMSNNQGINPRREHQIHIEELIQNQRNREIFGD